MPSGSNETTSSSVVGKVKLLCVFRLSTFLPTVYFFCLGLAGKLPKEENDCFMSTFYRSIRDLCTCKSIVYRVMDFHKVYARGTSMQNKR